MEVADNALLDENIEAVFAAYESGITAEPKSSELNWGLATMTFLYRNLAKERYQIDDQQAIDRAFELYHRAIELDPDNFALAADVAVTYFGITPPRPEQAIAAWRYVVTLARTDFERENAFLHLARTQIQAGLLEEASESLAQIKGAADPEIKRVLLRRLEAARAK